MTPFLNGTEHGRSSRNQELSSHHRSCFSCRNDSTIAKDTELMDVNVSTVDNLCTHSSIKRTNGQ